MYEYLTIVSRTLRKSITGSKIEQKTSEVHISRPRKENIEHFI